MFIVGGTVGFADEFLLHAKKHVGDSLVPPDESQIQYSIQRQYRVR